MYQGVGDAQSWHRRCWAERTWTIEPVGRRIVRITYTHWRARAPTRKMMMMMISVTCPEALMGLFAMGFYIVRSRVLHLHEGRLPRSETPYPSFGSFGPTRKSNTVSHMLCAAYGVCGMYSNHCHRHLQSGNTAGTCTASREVTRGVHGLACHSNNESAPNVGRVHGCTAVASPALFALLLG